MGAQYTSAVPAIVPDEEDLPGWVPKNYIEKGMCIRSYFNIEKNASFSGYLLPRQIPYKLKTTYPIRSDIS